MESRIDALLSKMTLEEKLGQMSQKGFPKDLTDEVRAEIPPGRWGSFYNSGSPAQKAEVQRIARRGRAGWGFRSYSARM